MPRAKKAANPKQTALNAVLTDIESLYPGSIMLGSDPSLVVHRRSTGVLPIDVQLDGGLPSGRFIEVFGPYSTLKSYYAYKALAAAQQRGERVALIDFEHSWDPDWGQECGIDTKTLPVARPETAEDGIGILNAFIKDGYDLVVWDSIAAAQPKQMRVAAPGSQEESAPAALARVMSRGLARLTASNKGTTAIFINQTRSTIGITFGPQTTTSGGKAMGFYASMRLSFMRTGKITETIKKWDGETMVDAKRVVGHKIKSTLEKSKVSAPYSEAYFVFDLKTGTVDDVGWLIGQGIESGDIQRSAKGGWHSIPGLMDKPIQGKDDFKTWLESDAEAQEWLLKTVSDSLTG